MDLFKEYVAQIGILILIDDVLQLQPQLIIIVGIIQNRLCLFIEGLDGKALPDLMVPDQACQDRIDPVGAVWRDALPAAAL